MTIPADKLAHASKSALFTVVAALICQHWALAAGLAFAIGLTRELLQHSGGWIQRQWPWTRRFAVLRGNGEWGDLLANVVGIAIAIFGLDLVGVSR